MKIGTKIFITLLIIPTLYLTVFVVRSVVVSSLMSREAQVVPISSQNITLQNQLNSLTVLETDIDSYLILRSEELRDTISQYSDNTAKTIDTLRLDPDTRSALLTSLLNLDKQIGALVEHLEKADSETPLNDDVIAIFETISELKNTYVRTIDAGNQEIRTIVAQTQKVSSNITTLSYIIGIFVFGLGLLLSWNISKGIVSPILKLRNQANQISQGNTEVNIEVGGHDEIGELAESFKTLVSKINLANTQLQKRSNILEQEVLKRTSELEEAKAGLEKLVSQRTAELEEAKAGLEKLVSQRTAEMEKKVSELEQINNLMVGRELKMVELKKENEDLKLKLGLS